MTIPTIHTTSKSVQEIGKEWDRVVHARHAAIENGKDISFSCVTAPCILRHIREDLPNKVLDVGCGSGFLTHQIAKISQECVGIDISVNSINIAKQKYNLSNLTFKTCEISKYQPYDLFSVCVANMVFSSDPAWEKSVEHIYSLLSDNGALYLTITHPCFWARYWGFEKETWFKYNEELYIETDFSISLEKKMGKTTYIHRPLSDYMNGLARVGFIFETIEEPYPISETPAGYEFSYPRFLFMKCRKVI